MSGRLSQSTILNKKKLGEKEAGSHVGYFCEVAESRWMGVGIGHLPCRPAPDAWRPAAVDLVFRKGQGSFSPPGLRSSEPKD